MERFDEYDCTSPQSHQHPDRVSDSLEDPISDEDVQPTRLSLACATTEKREKDDRMAGHDESAIWDEVQEEAEELAHVHKDPHAHSVSLLSAGTSKRSKCENKLKFSIRGFNSILSGVKSENLYAGEQEVSSGMRPAKAIETMVDEQVEISMKKLKTYPLILHIQPRMQTFQLLNFLKIYRIEVPLLLEHHFRFINKTKLKKGGQKFRL